MKNETVRFFARIICTTAINFAICASAFASPSGSPAGYTGSPGDGHHCVSCHGGSAATVTGWITSNIPAEGYTAGTIYNITVTVTGTGKKGFEVSPQNATGTQMGVLTAGSNNHLVGGTKYVTQNAAGSNTGTVTYNFTWTAPVAGSGPVTFYAACTVGKSNTKLTSLNINEKVVIPLTAEASAVPNVTCTGQSVQLDVIPAGGSGTYTYSWISIPAGFISSLQNPVASPDVSTQYIVYVSDGVLEVETSTDVTVNQPATANAGNDTTYNPETTQVSLIGVAENFSAVLWSTTGSGTFSAASSLAGFYFPSTTDISAGSVTLTLSVTAQSPCTNTSDAKIIYFAWPTGIVDAQGIQLSMSLSPNPSNGLFNLRISGLDNKRATVTVSDITGRTIVQRDLNPTEINTEKFDLSGSPKGLYLVKIQTEKTATVRKLVIE